MNAPNLTRSVIWGFVYSFEVMTQFMGRLARVPGQSGTCSFITFPEALSMFKRGTSDSEEIASALHSQVALDHIAFNTLHLDANVDSDQPLVSVPTLKDLRPTHFGGWFWDSRRLSKIPSKIEVQPAEWVMLRDISQYDTTYTCHGTYFGSFDD